eukprot:g28252.t1
MPLGDLVVGRTASIAAEGLLVKLPGQDAPALLPRQVAYSGIAVVWLYPDGSASVVVPEATAQETKSSPQERTQQRWLKRPETKEVVLQRWQELVATGQFPSLEKQDDTSMAPVRSKGRWGAAKEPKEPSPELENSKDSEASRLMPFLVAGHATDAPTYASVALVKPETTLSYVSQSSATKSSSANKDPAKEQESEDTIYSRKQLLTLRQSMLMMQDAGESASSPLPTSMPCKEEERVNCRAAVRQMQRQMQWVFQAGSVFLTASLLGAGQQHAANGHLHAAASSVVGQMWQRGQAASLSVGVPHGAFADCESHLRRGRCGH